MFMSNELCNFRKKAMITWRKRDIPRLADLLQSIAIGESPSSAFAKAFRSGVPPWALPHDALEATAYRNLYDDDAWEDALRTICATTEQILSKSPNPRYPAITLNRPAIHQPRHDAESIFRGEFKLVFHEDSFQQVCQCTYGCCCEHFRRPIPPLRTRLRI
jgi:hypothetical protein